MCRKLFFVFTIALILSSSATWKAASTRAATGSGNQPPLSRARATQLVEAFLATHGLRSPGLNAQNWGGAMIGTAQIYFEYQPKQQALKCSALIYRFHDAPKPGVLDGFRTEERAKTADTGGGAVEYEPQNRGLFLSRTYTHAIAEDRFRADMARLMAASLVWGDTVLDRVASRVFHPEELKKDNNDGNGTLIFVSGRHDDAFDIYAARPDGTNVRRLTRRTGVTDHEPALSPDKTRVAFVSLRAGSGNEIYVMDARDGGNIRRLTRNHKGAEEHGPAWSPDGRTLVFSSERDGNSEIYTMSAANGGDLQRLTRDRDNDRDPAWSPDGRQIAFIRNGQVCLMNARGGSALRRLTRPADGFHLQPAWSPDGRTLAVSAQRGGQTDYDIYLLSAADGALIRRLTHDSSNEESPAWSPNGGRIVFSSDRDRGQNDLYTVRAADGTGLTRLTNSPSEDSQPDWR